MKNSLLTSAVLSMMGVFGGTAIGNTSAVSSPSHALVAEAEIRTIDYASSQLDVVFLPITLHGHAATVLLTPGNDGGLAISPEILASKFNDSIAGTTLDSVTIGTVTERHFEIQRASPTLSSLDQVGLPPVVGVAGNEFLARYDVVVDGGARRIRLYAMSSNGSGAAMGKQAAWLPSGVTANDCTPMIAMPEHNPGFSVQVDGHAMTTIFETQSCCTWMNWTAARLFGITDVHQGTLPAKVRRIKANGGSERVLLEDVQLTLGQQRFTGDTLEVSDLNVDRYGTPVPTILINPKNLQHRTLVLSNSTHRVCLGRS